MIILPFVEQWVDLCHPKIPSDLYIVSNIGNVRSKSNMLEIKQYPSTNGFIYIALRTLTGAVKMFLVGAVVATSFGILPDDTLKTKPVKICYKNNDTYDNRPENIEWTEDVEEWKDMGEIGFNHGLWKISSHGRFYGTRYKTYLKQRILRNSPYLRVGGLAIGDKHSIEKFSHRLVAMAFVKNPKPEEYVLVNHINGDKLYNHYMNLEWVNGSMNNLHANYLGLFIPKYGEDSNSAVLTENDVHRICELLLKYNGNIYKVAEETNVNVYAIRAIRNGVSWKHISTKYFPLRHFIKKRPNLEESCVNTICETLLMNNMDVDKTFNMIHDSFNVTKSQIIDIKRKITYKTISDRYF